MWFWPDGDSWTSGGALPVPYQQYASGGYNIYLDVERPYEAPRDVDHRYPHHKWKPSHYRHTVSGDASITDHRRGRGTAKCSTQKTRQSSAWRSAPAHQQTRKGKN